MTIYSAARPGLVKGMIELAILGIICGVSCHYHVWKQCQAWFRTKKQIFVDTPRIVVITGCDRGDFIVEALALTSEAVSELQAYFAKQKKTNKHLAQQCNVTDEAAIAHMMQAVEQLLQEQKSVLFAIVNNAGIADPFVFDPDLTTYKKVMNVNFFGMLRITQALLPMMLRSSSQNNVGARIINMSSVCGAVASPGNAAYNASKFAVEAWSDSLRIELAPFHVAVTKVRPGQVKTQIQTDWQINYVKNFDAAPADIQELYGGPAFRRKVLETFQGMNNDSLGIPGDPATVVETLTDMLTLPQDKLQSYYWVVAVSDTLKRNLFYFAPVETSETKLKGQ